MSVKPFLQLNNFSVKDSRGHELFRVSLEVGEPGIVAIIGPDSSGKTLLLRAISGQLARGLNVSGERHIQGGKKTLQPPMSHTLPLPRGTVFRALANTIPQESNPERKIEETLTDLGLWEHFQEKLTLSVRGLSPAELLIVGACRRILLKEPLVLLDDPTKDLRPNELELFAQSMLNISRKTPVLWASRSLRNISPIAARMIILNQGRIVADGPSDHVVVSPGDEGEGLIKEAAGQSVAAGLDELYHELLTMGSLAERAVHQAVQSLTDQNLSIARDVLNQDSGIDRRERLIVDRALGLLGRTAPVGKELRTLVTVIKAATDLQRIADHAVNISEVTLAIGEDPLIKPLIDIPRMAEKAQLMVRYSLDALVRRDEALAREVLVHDGPVHGLYREVFEELLGFITDGGDAYRAGQALYLLFVARFLERVAEHATNIALHVIFMVSGERASRESRPEDDVLPHPFMPG